MLRTLLNNTAIENFSAISKNYAEKYKNVSAGKKKMIAMCEKQYF